LHNSACDFEVYKALLRVLYGVGQHVYQHLPDSGFITEKPDRKTLINRGGESQRLFHFCVYQRADVVKQLVEPVFDRQDFQLPRLDFR
jgi:hypothetical protein